MLRVETIAATSSGLVTVNVATKTHTRHKATMRVTAEPWAGAISGLVLQVAGDTEDETPRDATIVRDGNPVAAVRPAEAVAFYTEAVRLAR